MPSHQGTTGNSTNHPSSSLPDINDAHRPTLLGLFQLPAPLPPRSKLIEPRLGGQERMQEIQCELDVANEDLADKNEGQNELWELVDRLGGQAT